ncbi:MAG: methylmalonyl-CoA mutase family protein, partial [Desulfobulbaceae bacterium]|nr:methylmalonyl-CoA mutase family protein [Desulfobulbaceae bacterium]
VEPKVEEEKVARWQQGKAERDNEAVQQALEELGRAAREDRNLMAPVLAAVRAYGSLGEICNVLRGVFGEYRGRQW